MRFRGGVDDYLSVMVSQRALYAAEQELIATKLLRMENLVTLITKVLGGGWSDHSQNCCSCRGDKSRRQPSRSPVQPFNPRQAVLRTPKLQLRDIAHFYLGDTVLRISVAAFTIDHASQFTAPGRQVCHFDGHFHDAYPLLNKFIVTGLRGVPPLLIGFFQPVAIDGNFP